MPALPGGRGYLLAEANSGEYIRVAFPMYEDHGDTYPRGFIETDASRRSDVGGTTRDGGMP